MLALLATLALASCASAWNFTTPLDEYIALPDPTYTYFDTVRFDPNHILLLSLTAHRDIPSMVTATLGTSST
jgi:hypothetical protein